MRVVGVSGDDGLVAEKLPALRNLGSRAGDDLEGWFRPYTGDGLGDLGLFAFSKATILSKMDICGVPASFSVGK